MSVEMDVRNVVSPLSGVGYQVHVDPRSTMWGRVTHLEISNASSTPIHLWKDLQWIKNHICGEERIAVEIYPAKSRLVDSEHSYHLWVLPEGFTVPFGIHDLDNIPPASIKIEDLKGEFFSAHCPQCAALVEFAIVEADNVQPIGQFQGRVQVGVVGKRKSLPPRVCDNCHYDIEVKAGPDSITLVVGEKHTPFQPGFVAEGDES